MSNAAGREIAVGIDIGTSSVKAIAADADGNVIAQSRVPHEIRIPAPDRLEHDAAAAWRDGPREALKALELEVTPVAVSVSAMVPSLAAVNEDGVPFTPGLLYGDGRGRSEAVSSSPIESGELLAFLRWTASQAPDARGYWPATAVANHALSGEAVLDTSTASTAYPLFDWKRWDPELAASLNISIEQLPKLVPTGWACGHVDGDADGPVLASGCIDALADQIVAGADNEGDVLALLGTTLIVNTVTTSESDVPGCWVIPHTARGKLLAGGPSNAGGLFLNWATRIAGEVDGDDELHPDRVPVWAPYPRGERVPLHDPDRRAALVDLDLTHGPAAIRCSAFEAAGFVARRNIEAVIAAHGTAPRRIIATGGGTRVDEWVHALAYCTGLPVECTAVPEGAAFGSAFLARCAAGLEADGMTSASRWARQGRTVEPDPIWVEAAKSRYDRFLDLSK
ncbi:MAG: xylulose kinase [Acidimicrobiia bacterium]|nr:xylulose kinase [Acidimicrobiia bacterium]